MKLIKEFDRAVPSLWGAIMVVGGMATDRPVVLLVGVVLFVFGLVYLESTRGDDQ
jgi:hypothetical protein